MKILTTAGFSVLLLRKKLSPSQWLALLFLAIGVGIVQIQTSGGGSVKAAATVLSDTHSMNAMKGFMAVVAACFTSGLAGVYFEMVLKNSQADLWVRNLQLSLFSLLPALVPVVFSNQSLTGMFHNFGAWAWATVGIQVFGGLVTALVIKYSDNILKGFATSLSIVISFLASVALFDFHMSFTFVLGSLIVLTATWLYNQPQQKPNDHAGRESKGWSMNWAEKPKTLAFSRQSSGTHDFAGVAMSSRSASSSSVSSLTSPTRLHSIERESLLGEAR